METLNMLFNSIYNILESNLNGRFRGFIDQNGNTISVPEYSDHKYYAANEVNKYFETHHHKTYEYYKLIYDFPNFMAGKDSNRDPIFDFLYTGAIYITIFGGEKKVAIYKDVYNYIVEINGQKIPAWKILKKLAISSEYHVDIYTKYNKDERPENDKYINSAKLYVDIDEEYDDTCIINSNKGNAPCSPRRILQKDDTPFFINGNVAGFIDKTGNKHPISAYTDDVQALFLNRNTNNNKEFEN